MNKKFHKNLFCFTGINGYENSFFVLFLWYLLISKMGDFLIINTISQFLDAFILPFEEKLKVQHESVACFLCTNVLSSYVALFLGLFW